MEEKKCKRCNRTNDSQFLSCDRCRKNVRKNYDAYKDRLKKKGICLGCRLNSVANENGVYCVPCLLKQNKKYENKAKSGICVDCGSPSVTKPNTRCGKCLMKRRETRRNRVSSRLCASCTNILLDGDRYLCSECREKKREYREQKKLEGLCVGCHKNQIKKGCKSYCEECLTYYRNRKKTHKERGLCTSCSNPAISGCNSCTTCYLKSISRAHFGTSDYHKELLDLFVLQQGKCKYTGLDITLGVNAEIDHRIPKALSGSNDLANLQWVHCKVNRMKWDNTEKDFLEFVKNVYEYMRINEKT